MISILGAGPHGHEIADIAQALGHTSVMYDDDPDMGELPCRTSVGPVYLGAAWPMVRRRLANDVEGGAPLVHPAATVAPDASLAGGVVVHAGARVGHGCAIGAHTHLNLNVTVSRGCTLGAFVNVAPGANIAGGVIVEDDVFIGVGAVISHELVIGRGAVIGAGAVVVEDIPAGLTVAGNPARPLLGVAR